jgi:Septum formation
MAAPVGLSGSVPEPRHPETTDPEPVATDPVATETGTAEPVAAEPEAAEPIATKTQTAEPIATQTGTAEPIATKTEAVEPEAAEPEAAQPEAAQPEAAEPETAQPETAEPEAAEPEAAEPVAAEPTGQADEESTPVALGPEPEPADAGPAQHTDKVRRVRPLTVAALVLGIIALVGVAVGVLAFVTHDFRPKTIVTYRTAAVFSLRVGDCINSAPNGLSVTVLSCTTPHDAEVFATFSLLGSSWPGGAVVQQEATNGCMSRLGGYVNPAFANAGFAEEYVYPDQGAWQAGVRTVICEIRASSGLLTGSVRQRG